MGTAAEVPMESISYLDTPESWEEQLLRYIWRVYHTWILQSHGNSYSGTCGEYIIPGYSRVMGTTAEVPMEIISYLDTPESWEQLLRYIWRVYHTWILQSHGNSYSGTYGEYIIPGYSRVMGTATQVHMESISYLDTPESWEQLLRHIWRVYHTWILQSHGNSYSGTCGEVIIPGYSRDMGTAAEVPMESISYLDTPESWEQLLRYLWRVYHTWILQSHGNSYSSKHGE
jgi:hypothetical protein